jgi:hypothetical protein
MNRIPEQRRAAFKLLLALSVLCSLGIYVAHIATPKVASATQV